ncbi:hypothetical protein [Actinokineospora inagensis]|uniref:hypothetical protein n=1 Tax=Actinokineospora inagensis TaxID=103730 RepID=UPI000416AAB1|nr:hypothetical protein [Actinokineospora inagensis]
MVIRIIGAIIVIWLAFTLIGVVFKVLGTLLVVAAVATLGVAAYGAIKGRSHRQIR